MAGAVGSSRRERLRAKTIEEIGVIALRLMAEGGPDAISLRAIAREIGMTPSALYSYYPARDDLVTALIGDVYTELVDKLEAARDAHPEDDPAARMLAWASAFRTWAIANPQGFRLIYGDPIRGYQPPTTGPAVEAEHRACAGLVGLVAAAGPQAWADAAAGRYDWGAFHRQLTRGIRKRFPQLPPAAIAIALRAWGRMHGLVALEVYGHLPIADAGRLYEDEMRDLAVSLALPSAPSLK